MRRILAAGLAGLGFATCLAAGLAADTGGCTGCTGVACNGACVPACRGTWEEKKSSKPKYSMKCEFACDRGRDAWHAPPPECRCQPPCGRVYVKKRLFRTDGPEKVERVPKYEVEMVPATDCEPCGHHGCGGHDGLCWWNPLALLHRCTSWW